MNTFNTTGYRTFSFFNYLFLFMLMIISVYPFYYIFIYSVSIPTEAARGGVYFWPKGFTLTSYAQLLKVDGISSAFLVSGARAVIGTILTLFGTSLFAYVLKHPKLKFRKLMYRMTLATMYVSGGLIPMYITVKELGLKDNFLVYILPSMIVAFYLVLVKTYMEQLPDSLEESAMIDGAGIYMIYWKIIIPLIGPVLAVIAIFSAVNQWNSWQDNFFYVTDPKLQTLQLVLLSYLTDQTSNMMAISNNLQTNLSIKEITPVSIRMTITMMATLPVIFVYPLFQRYFISGIMVGAVKG
ncbi:carbohydrate ABC transporter permease [Paenibacillus eucommiae]|uniref:ABC-type glycerol-3-phosphate transport system permease component n=1 Tax=Paenibacillus eucommiae TaxID=1355755 RepID=A0ABS4J9X1_9BACL|nr:carbohydrate ABC transporter permease [Paenibacillus eucommiae]MBP1996040.1 ABC-type glycerol-3-phosphate transport system permease component [Paenibacillus eucommiae]